MWQWPRPPFDGTSNCCTKHLGKKNIGTTILPGSCKVNLRNALPNIVSKRALWHEAPKQSLIFFGNNQTITSKTIFAAFFFLKPSGAFSRDHPIHFRRPGNNLRRFATKAIRRPFVFIPERRRCVKRNVVCYAAPQLENHVGNAGARYGVLSRVHRYHVSFLILRGMTRCAHIPFMLCMRRSWEGQRKMVEGGRGKTCSAHQAQYFIQGIKNSWL